MNAVKIREVERAPSRASARRRVRIRDLARRTPSVKQELKVRIIACAGADGPNSAAADAGVRRAPAIAAAAAAAAAVDAAAAEPEVVVVAHRRN